MNALDDLDLAILAELEQNARMPISELARRLDQLDGSDPARCEDEFPVVGVAQRSEAKAVVAHQ